jgi:prepilin-type N-terminal cleavage/methylation domain-containing protein
MHFLRRGFSMMELLVVLVITGVVTGLSMGRFSNIIARERVAKAADGIANDIRTGFAIPGRIRRPVRIRVDLAAMQLLITDRAQSTTYRSTAFGSRYNIQGSNVTVYPSSPLEIYPNGFASDTMLITLTSNGISKSVRVSKAGMVQVK